MSEKGLLTKEQEKFYADLLVSFFPLKGIPGVALKWGLPVLVRVIDDTQGDKVPEPWASYARQLLTSGYLALQDGKVTQEELDSLISVTAAILNEKIDIPVLGEDEELFVFENTLKFLAAFVQKKALDRKQK